MRITDLISKKVREHLFPPIHVSEFLRSHVFIVIAKYNEDVSWTNELVCNYKIYDKSKDIPNVGREAETYLRYIIENYDSLPEYVVFLQGRPYDHLKERKIRFLNKSIAEIDHMNTFIGLNKPLTEIHNRYTRTREAFIALFDNPLPPEFTFSPGAQYIVHKSCILNRKKEFYELIRSVLVNSNNSSVELETNCLVCPWTLERMWPYIFDKTIKVRDVQYEDLL